ncbi:MAG TPA: alpha/beta fold hydrolase, partial [Lacisediminihabitans sp.]|uniref:alpha/beta hydrolase n=1 Tax=Lacisediminihabitans sp. TaxID=2787631 RepID=UPI002ED8FC68
MQERIPGVEEIGAQRVSFLSHGEVLAGALFLPDGPGPHPALVVTGAWRTVKEQMASGYARLMATRGFAALAFDHRGWGESGGRPRSMEDPLVKAEDIIAAAEYLATRDDIAPGAVGGLGVCVGSGYLAAAAARTPLIRSLAFVAPGLPSTATVIAQVGGEAGAAFLRQTAREAAEQFERAGEEPLVPAVEPTPENSVPGADYYTNPARGLIPEWDNTFNPASWESWLAFDAQAAADALTQPLLIVTSDSAVSPQSVREFVARVPRPVEERWLDGITQFEFYDRPDTMAIAADEAAAHFARTLSG